MRIPWFGKKSAEAPVPSRPAPPLPAEPGRPAWLPALAADAPWSYEAGVREAYQRNAVAQRAVRMVAEQVGRAPLMVAGEEAHPAAALLTRRVREMAATHLLLHGNAYLELGVEEAGAVVPADAGRPAAVAPADAGRPAAVAPADAGRPAKLWTLRPERVSIECGRDGWPVAHLYRAGRAVRRHPVTGERPGLVHLKLPHPTDDHLGLGCLSAAAPAVALMNAADRWNRALIDNAARPSGALVYEPGDGSTLSPDQFARLGAGSSGR